MHYQRSIHLPPFDLSPSAGWLGKYLLPLEAMQPFNMLGKAPMPSEVEIIGGRLSCQRGGDFGSFGNFRLAVVTPDYIAESGCPSAEECTPFGLLPIGTLSIRPGAPHDVYFDFETPILYRRGIDRIFVGPEVSTAEAWEFHGSVMVRGVDSEWPVDAGQTVWQQHLEAAAGGATAFCVRNRIPSISAGGSYVDVQFVAPTGGCSILNASIGVQSGSGADMVAAPVPLLFDGSVGATLGRLGRVRGQAALSVTAGQSLLVNVRFTNSYGYHVGGGDCWVSTTDSYSSAVMLGSYSHYSNIYCTSGVRVTA